jgi:hypothetical protein
MLVDKSAVSRYKRFANKRKQRVFPCRNAQAWRQGPLNGARRPRATTVLPGTGLPRLERARGFLFRVACLPKQKWARAMGNIFWTASCAYEADTTGGLKPPLTRSADTPVRSGALLLLTRRREGRATCLCGLKKVAPTRMDSPRLERARGFLLARSRRKGAKPDDVEALIRDVADAASEADEAKAKAWTQPCPPSV